MTMDSIDFKSPKYRVIEVLRKSKARYAEGISVGDVLRFRTRLNRTSGGSNGNYSLGIEIFVNGQYKATCSQNEVMVLFEGQPFGNSPIFKLLEL